jgi:hypothetical protein
MNETAHSPRTSPALIVKELFTASPRWSAGLATGAVALLTLAAVASTIG